MNNNGILNNFIFGIHLRFSFNLILKQESIQVGCVPSTFLVLGREICPTPRWRPPCRQFPCRQTPWMQTPLDAEPPKAAHHVDPAEMQIPCRQIPLDADHVTCDACWEANFPVNRMTHRCKNMILPQTSFMAIKEGRRRVHWESKTRLIVLINWKKIGILMCFSEFDISKIPLVYYLC